MRVLKVLFCVLLLLGYYTHSFPASTRVLLTPKGMEGRSEVIALGQSSTQAESGWRGEPYLLSYDTGDEASYLVGLATGFHLGVWFQSPAACTLLEIHYDFANGGAVTYYVADPSNGINFPDDYYEYHGGPNPSGPDPRESYLHPEESRVVGDWAWDTLDVAAKPDVGTDIFYAAYIMNDGNSNPIIDAGVDPPYHTLMYRIPSGGTEFGWYTSWHHVYIRALVSLYENVPPVVESYDRLPDTYLTIEREVTAHIWDIGVPWDSTGVAVAKLYYYVNGDSLSVDTLDMQLISGDSINGTYSGAIPGQSPWDTVTYCINATDLQGRTSENTPSHSYVIRAGTPGAPILFVNDDYYGAPFSPDPVAAVVPQNLYDFWDARNYGLPDSSVIFFGYGTLLWNTWDGSGPYGLVADTNLVMAFLDNGGNLFLSSQDLPAGGFGYGWGSFTTSPGEFCHDYLHMLGGVDDAATDTVSIYYGVPGDPITDPFSAWPVTVYPYGFAGPGYNYTGTAIPDTESVSIFHDIASEASGYRYSGNYKLVFLYWPFAYLVDQNGDPDTSSMNTLVRNILDWFGTPGVSEQLSYVSRPRSLTLFQNFANPFSSTTTISYHLGRGEGERSRRGDLSTYGLVNLSVYDLSGRLLKTLVDDEKEPGFHRVVWDGRDSSGREIPSGVYFYRLTARHTDGGQAGDFTATGKMVLLR